VATNSCELFLPVGMDFTQKLSLSPVLKRMVLISFLMHLWTLRFLHAVFPGMMNYGSEGGGNNVGEENRDEHEPESVLSFAEGHAPCRTLVFLLHTHSTAKHHKQH
jgi:hypothetical protein